MVRLPLRYELRPTARRNRTGNRGWRPDPNGKGGPERIRGLPTPNRSRFAREVFHLVRFGWSLLRVGRELNPLRGKPDPRVKSPMLYLAELPTRVSPRQRAVLYSVLQAPSRRLPHMFRGVLAP